MKDAREFFPWQCDKTVKLKDGRYLSVIDGTFYCTVNKEDSIFMTKQTASEVVRELFGNSWANVCEIINEHKYVRNIKGAIATGQATPEEVIPRFKFFK